MLKCKKMIIHKNLIQGSPDWLKARLGKISASNAYKLMTGKKLDKGATTYAIELINEIILEIPTFVPETWQMEHGHEYEPIARDIYQASRNIQVDQVGGIENNGLWYSPDGLPPNGLIEIKCPQPTAHTRFLATGEIDPKYYAQMQFGMMVSERRWCDYISFHPDYPDRYKAKVVRIDADVDYQNKLTVRINDFTKIMFDLRNRIE